MPGNAGGGKGPDFWYAFQDGEVVVIGDEPENTSKTGAVRDCCVGGRRRVITVQKPRAVGLLPVCLTVKPVGEPDALIGHVRFDERGWETERCRMAQATAPILDSTISLVRGERWHLRRARTNMVRGINSWRPKSVRLSKASYFADFAVYPPVVLALLILALRQAPSLVWIEWSIACLAGIAACL